MESYTPFTEPPGDENAPLLKKGLSLQNLNTNSEVTKKEDHHDKHKHKEKKGKGHGHSHSHGHGDSHGDAHGDPHAEEHDAEQDIEHQQKKMMKRLQKQRAKRALIYASTFTLIFMIAEIVGGWIAGSLAIMTDAAHLLTDVAAMLLSIFAMHLSSRPADHVMTFGYHRAEILGALASIFTIWILVGILCYEAILRLLSDAHLVGETVDGRIMTIIGICGFLVNIIDALILKWGNAPHGHSHGHGHGHGTPHDENVNVRAAFIHVLGDCLQSLGVIAAAVIIWVGNVVEFHEVKVQKSWWNMADPIASLLFGVITIFTTIKLTKNIVDVLMERVPAGIHYAEILRELQEIPNVSGVHDLHIWAISVGKVSLSCHLQSDDHVGVLVAAQKICKKHDITHTTIQVDPGSPSSKRCKHSEGIHE